MTISPHEWLLIAALVLVPFLFGLALRLVRQAWRHLRGRRRLRGPGRTPDRSP